jgi:protoporphyrin/coproporphyrin ferrochelatase
VRDHYARIGGKSPLGELTERQARALERELRKRTDARPDLLGARVVVAMRYWHPLTEEAVRQVAEMNLRRLVLLPLYPQYSKTTTGSSMNEWQRQFSRSGRNHTEMHIIRDFYSDPAYLDAVVEKINEGLARFEADESRNSKLEIRNSKFETRNSASQTTGENRKSAIGNRQSEDVHLVFSAHGVPTAVIEAGDPYQRQMEETVRLVLARGGWRNPHHLCYQSRVGPGRWLGPTLEETIRRLAAGNSDERHSRESGNSLSRKGLDARFRGHDGKGEGHPRESGDPPLYPRGPRLLVIPISFVSDHVETLAEIDLEARALARSLGLGQFELMPALNDSPKFIQALAKLVMAETGRDEPLRDFRTNSLGGA